jgi:hypothetical protein
LKDTVTFGGRWVTSIERSVCIDIDGVVKGADWGWVTSVERGV